MLQFAQLTEIINVRNERIYKMINEFIKQVVLTRYNTLHLQIKLIENLLIVFQKDFVSFSISTKCFPILNGLVSGMHYDGNIYQILIYSTILILKSENTFLLMRFKDNPTVIVSVSINTCSNNSILSKLILPNRQMINFKQIDKL